MNTFKCTVFVGMVLLGPMSQATPREQAVRIAAPAGVSLREQPSAAAAIVKTLDVGDGVSVLDKATADGREWAYVKAIYCVKGNPCAYRGGPGWILDEDLAYPARFEPVSSWKQQHLQAGVGDYWFAMDVQPNGSASLRYEPCVDCGTWECPRNFTREGSACVAQGRLFRYRDFLWAQEIDEYFFVNERGELCSVYSGEDGAYCTSGTVTDRQE